MLMNAFMVLVIIIAQIWLALTNAPVRKATTWPGLIDVLVSHY